MKRHAEGAIALIMLMGIAGVLAILAAISVMVLANQQHATASDRAHKNALDYAEAALDSAVNASKRVPQISPTAPFLSSSDMLADYTTAYPSGPTVTTRIYDDWASIDASTPAYDQNRNGQVWLEVTVTYQKRTRRLRAMVIQTETSMVTKFPKAALFSDQNIYLNSGADVYAVNDDGTPFVPSAPGGYLTKIMAGGNVQGNASTNLAAPGSSVQSVGVQANGSVSGLATGQTGVTHGGVPLLSDYFNQADQANLAFEAQAGNPTKANASATSYSSLSSLLGACTYNSGTKTYTASTDLKYSGNLTLTTAGTTYNFKSLYVTGNLTLNSTTHTHTTALYVGGDFTISGPTGSNTFGPTYIAGTATWSQSGSTALGVETTDYTDVTEAAGPLWVGKYLTQTGLFNDVLGPTWVCGAPGTSDIAVGLTGPSSSPNSTVMCPLLATTEKIKTSGKIDFGTVANPMVLYMQCDNDSLYTNTMEWGSTGTFTGLMAVMEAAFTGNSSTGSPLVVGAVFCIKDITITGNTSVCYNQAVLENIQSTAITTTTTTTTVVPGTWQEVSAN
jgi:hypothetical protein